MTPLVRRVRDPGAGIRDPIHSCLSAQRLDKYPRGNRPERKRAQQAADIRWINDASPLQHEAERCRNRGDEQQVPRVRRDARSTRNDPGEHRPKRSGEIQTCAPSANRQLHAGEIKGSDGSLMTDQTGSAIYRRRRRNQARVSTHQCVGSSKDSGNPEDRTDCEDGWKKPEHAAILPRWSRAGSRYRCGFCMDCAARGFSAV